MEHLNIYPPTDTAHAQSIVPIYLIHTIQNLFCDRPGCWCHTNQARIAQLLEAMKRQELCLADAASFADEKAE